MSNKYQTQTVINRVEDSDLPKHRKKHLVDSIKKVSNLNDARHLMSDASAWNTTLLTAYDSLVFSQSIKGEGRERETSAAHDAAGLIVERCKAVIDAKAAEWVAKINADPSFNRDPFLPSHKKDLIQAMQNSNSEQSKDQILLRIERMSDMIPANSPTAHLLDDLKGFAAQRSSFDHVNREYMQQQVKPAQKMPFLVDSRFVNSPAPEKSAIIESVKGLLPHDSSKYKMKEQLVAALESGGRYGMIFTKTAASEQVFDIARNALRQAQMFKNMGQNDEARVLTAAAESIVRDREMQMAREDKRNKLIGRIEAVENSGLKQSLREALDNPYGKSLEGRSAALNLVSDSDSPIGGLVGSINSFAQEDEALKAYRAYYAQTIKLSSANTPVPAAQGIGDIRHSGFMGGVRPPASSVPYTALPAAQVSLAAKAPSANNAAP